MLTEASFKPLDFYILLSISCSMMYDDVINLISAKIN